MSTDYPGQVDSEKVNEMLEVIASWYNLGHDDEEVSHRVNYSSMEFCAAIHTLMLRADVEYLD